MSHTTEKTEQELSQEPTRRLPSSVPEAGAEEYSLDSILAEFGSKTIAAPEEIPDLSSIPQPSPLPKPAVQKTGDELAAAEQTEEPVGDTAEAAAEKAEEEIAPEAPKRKIRSRLLVEEPEEFSEGAEPPEEEADTAEASEGEPRPRRGRIVRWFRPARAEQSASGQKTAYEGEEAEESSERTEESPERSGGFSEKAEKTSEQPEDTGRGAGKKTVPDFLPEEPEGPQREVPLEQVMSETVEAVLQDEDDEILEKPHPLRDFFRRRRDETEEFYENPRKERKKKEPEPEKEEPLMDDADRDARRLCQHKHRMLLLSLLPTGLLLAEAGLDYFSLLPSVWNGNILLRAAVQGGLLLLCALFSGDVWKTAVSALKTSRSVTVELCAGLECLVTLADCALMPFAAGRWPAPPFALTAAFLLTVILYGQEQNENARRESFHLLSLGGEPPYMAAVTEAGASKQGGVLHGFYNCFEASEENNPARRWQQILLPLLLSASLVLTGVICLTQKTAANFFWCWSALLTASLALSFPLSYALPMARLARRLARSGCAAAGYNAIRQVGRSKCMVVTDSDLFPPGTVGLNGLKVFGEEIGKVVSYAATVAKASESQLLPLFEQLLISEGGTFQKLDGLSYYEEGGVSGTIRGETVLMGTAYFMKKMRVPLPMGLKLQTGMFLALDGHLIAIFAIKYQPSRNVEWALRTMKRNGCKPLLAVRDGNITPGLLKRKFEFDVRAVYPDISTRLALSEMPGTRGERACAVIYREGLMPFAETVIGSRRCHRAVRDATVLSFLGSLCGLLLSYYLIYAGSFSILSPLQMLAFLLLWLLPCLLISGWVKHY